VIATFMDMTSSIFAVATLPPFVRVKRFLTESGQKNKSAVRMNRT